jgi:hypothetical protein
MSFCLILRAARCHCCILITAYKRTRQAFHSMQRICCVYIYALSHPSYLSVCDIANSSSSYDHTIVPRVPRDLGTCLHRCM